MDNISFLFALHAIRIHECESSDLNIVTTRYIRFYKCGYICIYPPLGGNNMQTYIPERYIPLAPTATSRDDYLGRAISQQRGTFTPHVFAILREPFRASSRDSLLTMSVCATVNRGTKFRHGVRTVRVRYSSELESSANARGMHVNVMGE